LEAVGEDPTPVVGAPGPEALQPLVVLEVAELVGVATSTAPMNPAVPRGLSTKETKVAMDHPQPGSVVVVVVHQRKARTLRLLFLARVELGYQSVSPEPDLNLLEEVVAQIIMIRAKVLSQLVD
jgi:hypothetical protein